MTSRTGTTVALTLAALAPLILGCALRKGPPDPAKVQQKMTATLNGEKALIRSTVAEPERAERLVELLGERDRLVAEHSEMVRSYRERMRTLNADFGAERESFEAVVADYNEQRSASQRQFAQLIDSMKKQTTAEEWKAVAKYQLKKLNPRDMAYDSTGGGS